MRKEPSPELKALLKDWTEMQRQKYGPDWKKKLAKKMSEQTMQQLGPLLEALRGKR